jgi:uncharacterized membrane protein YeiH
MSCLLELLIAPAVLPFVVLWSLISGVLGGLLRLALLALMPLILLWELAMWLMSMTIAVVGWVVKRLSK